MNSLLRTVGLLVGCSLMVCSVVGAGAFVLLGYKFNPSASAPVGIWKLDKSKVPEMGDYVFICPPAVPALTKLVKEGALLEGRCSSTTTPFIKSVAGVYGDTLDTHKDHGVFIDGVLQPNTKPFDWPGLGMAPGRVLRQGEFVALQTNHAASIDSRYFGALKTKDIIGVIEPVWVIK